ncbi:hypothetical protein [Pseudoduganella chitinolytica]|uniref:Uncharacterized protein n=1 Tax=Pseudoduganella chitinolytica TaxID=34070 RepID=A0ABY8BE03_9BURK|nr:hypothetical protein [Pseudoduganella chitinolytica]WEF34140.1 hypothetical protein PX653_05050 [Pseudoduganella chitinolytica]
MKSSVKAALCSALLFPGLGQLIVLKRPARAALCMIPALAAVLFLLWTALAAASAIVDRIAAGTLALDPVLIQQQIEATNTGPGSNIAAAILIVAWLGSIVDALFHKP